jgi:hypothetical protein
MVPLGKLLVAVGILVLVAGVMLWVGGSIPLVNRLGRLPGDIYVQRGNYSLYFPLTTAILVSVAVSLLLAVLRR